MNRLRRFNPPNLWKSMNIELRENKHGIRIYEFNYRTLKYDKFLGLIEFHINGMFLFTPQKRDYGEFYHTLNQCNDFLIKRWGPNAYLTEEAVEYLMSVNVMNRLIN